MKKSILKQKLIINLVAFGLSAEAYALHPGEPAAVIACGKLESFSGGVQVFDASRTSVIDVGTDLKLQCGDWISVSEGKAMIRHKLGYQVTLGAGSFMQILDPHGGENPDQDHFALYRGQAIFKNDLKTKELSVATANSRAKFKSSGGYLLYATDIGVTQLVGIEGSSILENRFLDVRPIVIKKSEVSSMGELESRPIPRTARPVLMTSLRERLAKLGVSQDIQKQMLEKSKVLAETKMPVTLEAQADHADRKIASIEEHSGSHSPGAAPVVAPQPTSMAAYELSKRETEVQITRPSVQATRKIASSAPRMSHVKKASLTPVEEENRDCFESYQRLN